MSPSFLDDAAAPDSLPASLANLRREELLAWCARAGVAARIRTRQHDGRILAEQVALSPELSPNDIATTDVKRAVSLHLRAIARDAGYLAVREYLAELDGVQTLTAAEDGDDAHGPD